MDGENVPPNPQQGPTSPMTPPKATKRSFLSSPSKSPTNSFPTRITPPRTPSPPPSDGKPLPLRYPETLGTVIEIHEAEGKGLGVFAARDIPSGSILLSEAPLVTLMDTGTRADPLDATVLSLSPSQRASFVSLCAFSRNANESRNRSIVYSNGYAIGASEMATGVFETASRINHSCVPNSSYAWKDSVGRMVFYNRFKLLEGEEVTVDYGHKRGQLKRIYGFDCQCGGCTEWGSVDSSSRGGSETGEGEKGMGSLNTIVEAPLYGGAARDTMDEVVAKIAAVELHVPEVEGDLANSH